MFKINISKSRMAAMEKVFGKKAVDSEVRKFADNFKTADQVSALNENKETFNGSNYLNVAPGEIEEINTTTITPDKKIETNKAWGKQVNIMKTYIEKRIVIGAVYVPYDENDESTIDSHGHACLEEDIEKAAYQFMKDLNNYNIDQQHNFTTGYGYVVESYIAKAGDPLFKKGTWVLGVKVTNDDTWSSVEKGEITGFSLAGSANLESPDSLGL